MVTDPDHLKNSAFVDTAAVKQGPGTEPWPDPNPPPFSAELWTVQLYSWIVVVLHTVQNDQRAVKLPMNHCSCSQHVLYGSFHAQGCFLLGESYSQVSLGSGVILGWDCRRDGMVTLFNPGTMLKGCWSCNYTCHTVVNYTATRGRPTFTTLISVVKSCLK